MISDDIIFDPMSITVSSSLEWSPLDPPCEHLHILLSDQHIIASGYFDGRLYLLTERFVPQLPKVEHLIFRIESNPANSNLAISQVDVSAAVAEAFKRYCKNHG